MPPRRAASRRAGPPEPQPAAPVAAARASPSGSEDPDEPTSSRPSVGSQNSFSYGTNKMPTLPLPLETNPNMTMEEMARNIDEGLREASEREQELRAQHQRGPRNIRTRSQTRRSESVESSPAPSLARRRRRQPTPDDQLIDNLHDGSSSLSSDQRENSVSDSVISWRVERNIHGNQPASEYVEEPRARSTLAAKPRRPIKPSALREMIKEEPEDAEDFDISSLPTSEVPKNAETKASSKATRPTSFETVSAQGLSTIEPVSQVSETRRASTATTSSPTPLVTLASEYIRKSTISPLTIVTIILAIVATFGTYTFSDKLAQIPNALSSSPIFGGVNSPHVGYNLSDISGHATAINQLSSQFDKLGDRFRDMSKEINDLRADWGQKLPMINDILSRSPSPPTPEAPRNPLSPPRVNFCSIGLGAVIDPYLTTPTRTKKHGFLQRLHLYAAGVRQGPSAANALQPWDGVGDSWCSSTPSDMTQLGVLLGRKIVPEEVIVEHIPKEATLDPGSAPRDMELWAEYKTDLSSVDAQKATYTLHSTILETLREAYPGEPESAYSDDMLLGPNFYRIGKWQYDIEAENHIQGFKLNAVIDMPDSRVEKVVFRANTNWGADHTCIYRVRLHGHL
ncbi:hypothetical protein FQN54_006751 [Arachnomyces sp. PD_36]|nr:hypothetical protein FQN54_006751 [Arachnomyces sp. PD_36]